MEHIAAFTVVQIPVREAETIVRERLLRFRPEALPEDRGVAAHVTLLGPFMEPDQVGDGVLEELTDFFADVTPFGFRLTSVAEFPGGTAYLTPEPHDVFRRLTIGLHRLFPGFPPYGGEFDDVVPHLTVPIPPGEDTASLRTALHRRLPIDAHATEAALVSYGGTVRTLARFRFGTAAA